MPAYVRFVWIGIFVAVLAAFALPGFRLESRAGAALRQAVPGYSCAPLHFRPSRSQVSWTGGHNFTSGALETTRACLADFEAKVRSSGQFTPRQCLYSRRCWGASRPEAYLEVQFWPDGISYSYRETEAP